MNTTKSSKKSVRAGLPHRKDFCFSRPSKNIKHNMPAAATKAFRISPRDFKSLDFWNIKEKRLRTSNIFEMLSAQIKRPTHVAELFSNTDSFLRLVTAIFMELSEEWETGKDYLSNKQ
jgi:transposase-like protein